MVDGKKFLMTYMCTLFDATPGLECVSRELLDVDAPTPFPTVAVSTPEGGAGAAGAAEVALPGAAAADATAAITPGCA